MLTMKFENILEAVKGRIIKKGNCFDYESIGIDTRKIGNKTLFIAIKGENFNGNDYIIEASKKGAVICIVDEVKFELEALENYTSIIIVEDTKKALLDLAKYYRSLLDIKIVAITGSTGKTSTKDITAAVLSEKYRVFKTSGNFNNEIGMPLMLLNLGEEYDIAVLEMGMSNFGEIHNMVEAARPDVSIITNIGISHLENLKTQENILEAKMEITDFFNQDSILIVNGDDNLLNKIENNDYRVIKTGTSDCCEYIGQNIVIGDDSIEFSMKYKEANEYYHIELLGRHNVLNSLLAIACGKIFGLSQNEIKIGLKNIKSTSMRLDIIKASNFKIINDCYNASPDSMKAAIDVMVNIKGGRKIAVLGTMRELGEKSYDAHREVGKYVKENKIEFLLCAGEYSDAYKEGYLKENINGIFKYFSTYDELTQYLQLQLQDNDVVLIKASRTLKFEIIVNNLLK